MDKYGTRNAKDIDFFLNQDKLLRLDSFPSIDLECLETGNWNGKGVTAPVGGAAKIERFVASEY